MRDTSHFFRISVAPGPAGARQTREILVASLTVRDVADKCRNGIALAVAEWITNLGTHPTHLPRQATTTLRRVGNTYLIELEDDGSSFANFPDALRHPNTPALSEHGMGLQLMAAYFPVMTYTTTNGRNRLRLHCQTNGGARKSTVLLVDDDPVIRDVYGEFLTEDYHLFLADSAEEGLEILHQADVDLIISDIRMPDGASGLELCATVRKEASLETIPFIFLTGEYDSETREAAQGMAIDDYLLKPVRKAALRDSARRVVRNARFVRSRLSRKFDDQLTNLLVPSLPDTLGPFRAEVRFQAAEAGGGDVLYWRRWESETLIVIADIMGHGPQAKFFSQALTGYLSGLLAATATLWPEIILNRLNKAFNEDRILSQTLTTAAVVLLKDNGRCLVANGGHPQPLLTGDGDILPIPATGSLPGLDPDFAYRTVDVRLEPGQRLILHTDGLKEIGASPNDHEESFEKILSVISGKNGQGLSETADAVSTEIAKIADTPILDDITLALLEYVP